MTRTSRNTIHIQSPLHHVCQACGMSCQGIHVWLTPEERPRVRELGARWGFDDVVEDNHLAFHDGRCRFLDAAGLCRVHAELGYDAKPLICRQYPVVLVRTEDGVRGGLDPGCYQTWQTWRDGPPVTFERCAVERRLLEPRLYRQEQGLLELLDAEDLDLARFACLLAGRGPEADGMPVRLAHRMVERLQLAPLRDLLSLPGGEAMRRVLGPLMDAIPRWSPHRPPTWPPTSPADEALAIETIRRMIFLRIGTHPTPMHTVVLMLVGAIACAWADPRREVYGPALAGWSRAIRAEPIWRSLAPREEALMWLARGYAEAPRV